jgi:hypothetical protein
MRARGGVRQKNRVPQEYLCICASDPSGASDNGPKPDAPDDLLRAYSNWPVGRVADPRRGKAYFGSTGESCRLRRCMPPRATPFDISSPDSSPPLSTACGISLGMAVLPNRASRAEVRYHAYC